MSDSIWYFFVTQRIHEDYIKQFEWTFGKLQFFKIYVLKISTTKIVFFFLLISKIVCANLNRDIFFWLPLNKVWLVKKICTKKFNRILFIKNWCNQTVFLNNFYFIKQFCSQKKINKFFFFLPTTFSHTKSVTRQNVFNSNRFLQQQKNHK